MQPVWLCIVSGRQLEDTFENAQWRKATQMHLLLPIILSCKHFESSFNITQWRKVQRMCPYIFCTIFLKIHLYSHSGEKPNKRMQCDFVIKLRCLAKQDLVPSVRKLLRKWRCDRRYIKAKNDLNVNSPFGAIDAFAVVYLHRNHDHKQNQNYGVWSSLPPVWQLCASSKCTRLDIFFTHGALKRHLKTHSGKRWAKCSQCDYVFEVQTFWGLI